VVYLFFTFSSSSVNMDALKDSDSNAVGGGEDNETISTLEKKISAFQEELANAKARIQSLTNDLDTAMTKENELLKEKEKYGKFESSFDDLKSEVTDLKCRLTQKDRELDEARSLNFNLTKDTEAYHLQLISAKEENEKMEGVIKELKQQQQASGAGSENMVDAAASPDTVSGDTAAARAINSNDEQQEIVSSQPIGKDARNHTDSRIAQEFVSQENAQAGVDESDDKQKDGQAEEAKSE
jgi:chromosome segregation ATPase